MAQQITLLGANYSDVPGILLPKQGGGEALFTDVTSTTATASDVAQGKIFFASDGSQTVGTASGGGGGGLSPLATLSMGTISTSSTTATDTGKTITVSGIDDYDLLIFEASRDSTQASRHMGTVNLILLTAGSTVFTKNGATLITSNTWNAKNGTAEPGTGVVYTTTRQNGTRYGIYANSVSVSSGSATITIYQRYNSTQTGTINGTYTVRVYGVSLYDLIGG